LVENKVDARAIFVFALAFGYFWPSTVVMHHLGSESPKHPVKTTGLTRQQVNKTDCDVLQAYLSQAVI
jgi:hypothetical protein